MFVARAHREDEKLILWSWKRGAEWERITSMSYILYNYHILDEPRAETTSFASHFLDVFYAIPLGEDELMEENLIFNFFSAVASNCHGFVPFFFLSSSAYSHVLFHFRLSCKPSKTLSGVEFEWKSIMELLEHKPLKCSNFQVVVHEFQDKGVNNYKTPTAS